MQRVKIIFTIVAILSGVAIKQQCRASNKWVNHGEIWEEISIGTLISENLSTTLLFNNLYRDDLKNYDWFFELKLKYKFNSRFALEAMYRDEHYIEDDTWLNERRPMLRFSYQKEFSKWKIRNRQRFECRIFENEKTRFRYRTDIKASPILNLTSWNITPYIQEEFFVYRGEFSRVRSYLGVEAAKGVFEPAIYALIQSKKKEYGWQHEPIVGVLLAVVI